MPFLVLLILALAFLQHSWPAPPLWLTPWGAALVTWCGVALVVGFAAWIARRIVTQLAIDAERSNFWLRRYARWRRWHLLAMLVVYLLAVYPVGWGWTAVELCTWNETRLPGAELLIALPFFAALLLSWSRFYDVEVAVRRLSVDDEAEPTLGRLAYVGLHGRQSLILAAPPFFLLFFQQILLLVWPGLEQSELVLAAISGGLLAVLFAGYPWLLRILLNLKPLPPGQLRDRLTAASQRLSFRCNDVLVWNTHDSVATAMLTGPMPFLRYVVLTDRLIQGMNEDEIEAVFAHEIGHVKHRHIPYYFLFFVFSLIAVTGFCHFLYEQGIVTLVENYVLPALPWAQEFRANLTLLALIPILPVLGAYTFLVFGLLSRRCERQADLYACRVTSFEAFISALEKVAWLNGMSRDRPGRLSSWRHGSIAERVAFLQKMHEQPWSEVNFQQETGLLKWGTILGLGLFLLILGPSRIWDFLQHL